VTDRLTGVHILLVEDEPLIGMITNAALSEAGAQVQWVQTDREAYECIAAQGATLDLLITDINLREGTTGFDISRYARRLLPHLPIIYMSGEVSEVQTFAVEGATFISKPIPETALLGIISAQLGLEAITAPQRIVLRQ
jgi:DNA-binding response OmpR family regulator